jgi:hypothetical protein
MSFHGEGLLLLRNMSNALDRPLKEKLLLKNCFVEVRVLKTYPDSVLKLGILATIFKFNSF